LPLPGTRNDDKNQQTCVGLSIIVKLDDTPRVAAGHIVKSIASLCKESLSNKYVRKIIYNYD
jgi:hypothetical protein